MAILRLIGLMLLMPTLAVAADLSGHWKGSDGGDYYLVQHDNQLYWYAEQSARKPGWSHIFDGHVAGEKIRGKWTDVPKGKTRNRGSLELRIREGGNVLEITRKKGGFGGDRLTRLGYVKALPMKPPMRRMEPEKPRVEQVTPVKPSVKQMERVPARPPVAMTRPQAMSPAVREDCIDFDWRRAARKQVNGSWKIVDGSHWLFDFGSNATEAAKALRVIKRYRLDSTCFVGRPNPSLSYLLSNGSAPAGAMSGEDCISFNPDRATVTRVNGKWKLVDGSHWLFDFGASEDEARQALAIIKRYKFNHSCFVGRPDPSFSYLRR